MKTKRRIGDIKPLVTQPMVFRNALTYPLDTWSSGPEPNTVSSGEVIRCSISRLFGLKVAG